MIKVNQIEKNYGKFHLNCTMEVPDGCVTGLIGENGAGKSTVFKAIENLIFLDGGSIEVFGKPHTELNAKDREQIAICTLGCYLFQCLYDQRCGSHYGQRIS